MKEDYINLMKGNVNQVDENLIYPLTTWCSGHYNNFNVVQLINRNMFFINKKLSLLILSKGLRFNGFTKYPKQQKFDNKAYDLIVYYFQKEFKYGKSDISSMHKLILMKLKDKQFLEEFASRYGLDNKERKILDLQPIKLDKKVTEKPKGINLMNF